jgi:hypothetical protein
MHMNSSAFDQNLIRPCTGKGPGGRPQAGVLVFQGLGVEAVRRAPPERRGMSRPRSWHFGADA